MLAFNNPWYLLLLGLLPFVWWFSFGSLSGLGRWRRLAALGLRTLGDGADHRGAGGDAVSADERPGDGHLSARSVAEHSGGAADGDDSLCERVDPRAAARRRRRTGRA